MDDSKSKISANLDNENLKIYLSKSKTQKPFENKENNYNIIAKKLNDNSPFQTDYKIQMNKNSLKSNNNNIILGKRSHQKFVEYSSILNNEKSKLNDYFLNKPNIFIPKKPKIEISRNEKISYCLKNKENYSGKDQTEIYALNKSDFKINSHLKLLNDESNNKIKSVNLDYQKIEIQHQKLNDSVNLIDHNKKTDKKQSENDDKLDNFKLENSHKNLLQFDKPLDLMDICKNINTDDQNRIDAFIFDKDNRLEPDIHKISDNDNKNELEETNSSKGEKIKPQSKQMLEGISSQIEKIRSNLKINKNNLNVIIYSYKIINLILFILF